MCQTQSGSLLSHAENFCPIRPHWESFYHAVGGERERERCSGQSVLVAAGRETMGWRFHPRCGQNIVNSVLQIYLSLQSCRTIFYLFSRLKKILSKCRSFIFFCVLICQRYVKNLRGVSLSPCLLWNDKHCFLRSHLTLDMLRGYVNELEVYAWATQYLSKRIDMCR